MLLLACPCAQAQDDQATQRQMNQSSMERDQQSDAFALRLQQQQQELLVSPVNAPALQDLQAAQRRNFDQLVEDQRMQVRNTDEASWGPRLNLAPQMERERRMALDRARREAGLLAR